MLQEQELIEKIKIGWSHFFAPEFIFMKDSIKDHSKEWLKRRTIKRKKSCWSWMEGKEERLLVMDAEERRRAEGCLNMRGLVFHHLLHMFRNLSALLLSSQVAEVCVWVAV
jgi:hypothetical protein